MARLRTIKPEFWSDEALGECSLIARLLFVATWNFADDYGNIERSARQLKAQAFPYDDVNVEELLLELIAVDLLVEYNADGKNYLHIKNFHKHQRIDRMSSPRCPPYGKSGEKPQRESAEHSSSTRQAVDEHSSSTRLPLDTERKGIERNKSRNRRGDARGEDVSRQGAPPTTGSRSKTGTRIPDDFTLTPERRQIALNEKLDPERVFANFTDYWKQQSGARARKADWEATWRLWCRNEFSRSTPATNKTKSTMVDGTALINPNYNPAEFENVKWT